MTAKAALAAALLEGNTLNVKNCFTLIGLTNCAREISRMIEQPFEVTVKRIPRKGKSRYGMPVTWFDYKLINSPENKPGIERMKLYVLDQVSGLNPKTDTERKQLKQLSLI